jgi:hypothetical protein
MRLRAVPAFAAAGAGFLLAAALFASRPARAQFNGPAQTVPAGAVTPAGLGAVSGAGAGVAAIPQPIQIQALDNMHFVVATREPRLVQPVGREGTATNMLVTVVTYYTVAGNRLIPVEHIRAPAGWQPVVLLGE